MKWKACLLVVLTSWAQFDGALLTSSCAWEVDSLVSNDDDECLSSDRREQQDQLCVCLQPHFINFKLQTADLPSGRSGLLSEWNLTTPFTPPSLYVFMSLQI